MIVIDSGLGGIAVARALRRQAPGLSFAYMADTAGFPYGNRSAGDIISRASHLIHALAQQMELSTIVLACNTLSTLTLATLRELYPHYHFVGTVPAIKVAAGKAKRFTLLATPNTAGSTYSRQLVDEFASDCVVDHYGAMNLARYAEAHLLGDVIDADSWRDELAPAFFDDARGRTEAVILGCTHYPLVLEQLKAAAPWPVEWIDSSEAIARRALALPYVAVPTQAFVTGEVHVARYRDVFAREGFSELSALGVADRLREAVQA